MPGTISRLFGNVPSTSKKLPPPMGNPMAPDKDGGGMTGSLIRRMQGMMPAGAPAGQGPGVNREALIARLNAGPTQGPLAMAQAPTDANASRMHALTGQMPTTTYSGSYRDQPLNKVNPAANREGILARLNGAIPATPEGGNFGGNTTAAQNAQGQSFFRAKPTPTDFAGAATNAGEAQGNRMRTLLDMQKRNIGSVDPQTGAFMGYGSAANKTGLQGNSMETLRGRLAAGGIWKSTATPEQLAGNKTGMLARLQGRRDKAMGMVQEQAAQQTLARDQRLGNTPQEKAMSPMMAQLMLAREGNMSREKIAGIGAQGDNQRNQMGLFAALLQNPNIPPENVPAIAQALAGQQGGGVPGAAAAGGLAGLLKPNKAGAFHGANQDVHDAVEKYAQDHSREETEQFIKEQAPPDAVIGLTQKFAPPSVWERLKKPGPFGGAVMEQKHLPWWRKSNFGF